MRRLKIAVIGSGISGLSAAWLLSKHHDVVVFEADDRIGGHANTVRVITENDVIHVDTGFIVYNQKNYPNFCALLSHLDVATDETEMSFSVSLNHGDYEYSGSGFSGFFGQKKNLIAPMHWRLLLDIARFFRTAERQAANLGDDVSLGEFLDRARYSQSFVEHHILPMAAAIWSANKAEMLNYPARSFISFYGNHGMLQFRNRPLWRTVKNGSKAYLDALLEDGEFVVHTGSAIKKIVRNEQYVELTDGATQTLKFDEVVVATHADQALNILHEPTEAERKLLSCFSYQSNKAVLHRDATAMPLRKSTWASWNYVQENASDHQPLTVTYWMNSLQNLGTKTNYFVTLNPIKPFAEKLVDETFDYDHPMFDVQARKAQKELWKLQGINRTWFCGSYFGSGFHEDGAQAGLAAAEHLGRCRRPWRVEGESSRIHVSSNGRKKSNFEATI